MQRRVCKTGFIYLKPDESGRIHLPKSQVGYQAGFTGPDNHLTEQEKKLLRKLAARA